MTYPIWGGFNTGYINDTEINGPAPSPALEFDGFNDDVVPVLMGGVAGLYSDVMDARGERRDYTLRAEDRGFEAAPVQTALETLPENRAMDSYRSRKVYP